MHTYFLGDELILNRVPEPLNVSKKIKQYGDSNLYPQIVHSIMLRSPLTKSAVKILADFFRGDGFQRSGDVVLNKWDDTLNDTLKRTAEDLAEYRGFALHFNFNAAAKQTIVEVTAVPFEYVRLGLPNKDGISKDVKVSNNWEYSNISLMQEGFDENIHEFPLYKKGKRYGAKGAILYYSDLGRGRYPLCSFDPLLDNAQSDASCITFELSNLLNGFHSGTIFKHYGPFENDRAKDLFLDQIKTMTGPSGAASSMVVEVDEALENANLVEQIPATNNSDLFTQTTINIRNRVLQFFNIPSGIFGVAAEGAVFQADELGSYFV
jgi:hypothetical protein